MQGAQDNKLTFYINDEEKQVYTTTTNQYASVFELPPEGTLVTVKWVFKKNAQSANNKDLAWLDNIRISGTMDSDFDGFNDAWELKYFGNLTTLSSRDDSKDYDQDGMTNQKSMTITPTQPQLMPIALSHVNLQCMTPMTT